VNDLDHAALTAMDSAAAAAATAGIGPRGHEVLATRRLLAEERQATALERIAQALEDLELHPNRDVDRDTARERDRDRYYLDEEAPF